jgi:hypothetical protein
MLALALLAAAAPPAGAEGARLRVIARSAPWPVVTDGGSFSARDHGSSVTVTDEARHRRLVVQKPASCQPQFPFLATELVAIGGGKGLLDSCLGGLDESQPTVFDLRTGGAKTLPHLRHIPDSSSQVSAVGNRWLEVTVRLYHETQVRYLDWWTGEEREDDGSASVAPDLNDPALMRPLCSPLVRRGLPPDLDYERRGWAPYSYAGGFGATAVPRRITLRSRLTLQRCGSSKRQLLDRDCGYYDCQTQLGAGVVSWLEERPAEVPNRKSRVSVHAYVIRTGRMLSWKRPLGTVAKVAHTRRALYVSVRRSTGKPTWRLLKARLPR